jgi:hypothetical protein
MEEKFCAAHYRRTGQRVVAYRLVDGEGMCRACFRGLPVDPKENLDRLNTVTNVPFVKPKGEPPQTPEEEEHSLVQSSLSPGRLITVRRW